LISLGSPWMLVFLTCVPVIVLAYVRMVQARARRTERLASQGLVQTAAARRAGRRRHVPFALFTAALALLCLGLARPTMLLTLPHREGTVILAFDVSNSMRAEDLEPTRLEAAKAAATAFAERQPSSIRVGVVSFGDSAVTALEPTEVKDDVLAAIKRLSVGGGTSLGQGLLASLTTIAGKPLEIDEAALESDAGQVNIGFFGASAIIVLSDGENTSRPDPLALAEIVLCEDADLGDVLNGDVPDGAPQIADSIAGYAIEDTVSLSAGTKETHVREAAQMLRRVRDAL